MSSNWLITEHPNENHDQWSVDGSFFLASERWSQVVRTLCKDVLFAWSKTHEIGTIIPIFKRFGERIAFVGFPLTSDPIDKLEDQDLQTLIFKLYQERGISLTRVARGNRDQLDNPHQSARRDFWISDLPSWKPSKRLRRDLKYAERKSADLRITPYLANPNAAYSLYTSTLKAHGAKPRYTTEYFHALAGADKSTQNVIALSAMDDSKALVAFVVMVRHGQWAYYLHGAANDAGRKASVSDLLLKCIIEKARDLGCSCFSMMASPWNQSGLALYKSKWCDTSGLATTSDYGFGALGRIMERVSFFARRHDRLETERFQRSI
jgi:hypothetical protein